MKLGILYEGLLDHDPLTSFVKKIIEHINVQISAEINTEQADGSIEGSIERAANIFITLKNCSLCIFVADIDHDNKKKTRITRKTTQYCKKLNPIIKIVHGFPDPVLEQWFIEEQISLKKVLKLPMERPIPHAGLKPKLRLEKLFNEADFDITITLREIYGRIASDLNTEQLRRESPSFKRFYESLKEKIIR